MGWSDIFYLNPLTAPFKGIYDLYKNRNPLAPDVNQQPTMTPEQQEYYSKLLKYLQGNMDQTRTPMDFFTAPTEAPENPYGPQSNELIKMLMSGDKTPAYTINPETTEQYFQNTIANPATYQYENVTRPAWMEKMGTLHSGARMNMERQGYEDLGRNLSEQRSNLYYQDELSRRKSLEDAANRDLMMKNLGLEFGQKQWDTQSNQWKEGNLLQQNYQQQQLAQYLADAGLDQQTIQNMLQALGLTTTENIVSPSPLESILNLLPGIDFAK